MNTKPLQLQLDKSAAAGLKRLPQIQALIAQQKFVQAEGELNEVIDDIVRSAVAWDAKYAAKADAAS